MHRPTDQGRNYCYFTENYLELLFLFVHQPVLLEECVEE